jgi:hypothetical protein
MYIVDDPTLALIARFVSGRKELDFSDAPFFRDQIAAVQRHVGRYPPEEAEARALEWVQRHARQYRRVWQKTAMAARLSAARCPDCPLARGDLTVHCEIHDRWLDLLTRYVDGSLSSAGYVQRSLGLLRGQKSRLKVTGRACSEGE